MSGKAQKTGEQQADKPQVAFAGLTQKQIDGLKKKYGKLHALTVHELDIEVILRKPDMVELDLMLSRIETNPVTAMKEFYDEIVLAGDNGYSDDAETFMSIMPQLRGIMKKYSARLEEL